MATKYLNRTTGFGGYCLKWVRLCFGVGPVHPTAYKAWQATKHKHKGDRTPPPDVPVWFGPSPGTTAGHVAYSLGNGRVRTTNSATNRIHNTTIDVIAGRWGNPYLGWSEDINGKRVYTPPRRPSAGSNGSKVLRRGVYNNATVRKLQTEMNRVFPLYSRLAVDGDFGVRTERVVKEFQRRAGLRVDGLVGPATRAALTRYGVRL